MRKIYSDSIYEYDILGRKAEALVRVKELYDQEYLNGATNPMDARVRDLNLEKLGKLRESLTREVKLQEERQQADKAAAARVKAEHEAEEKARVMADLRKGFAGSDADFDRLKDQLYDNHLLNAPNRFEQALAKARQSGKYSI